MEVFNTPEVLVIHFKRFSHTRNSMFGSKKISDFIDFPVNGLNMTPFIRSNQEGNKQIIYDLYGVSNHFGSLSGGHYTAFCKNILYKRWFNFDDTDVSKVNESDLTTKAAYVLFYKLRKE
jgi:ubiquitin carboxyl-terminal hydrolase 4/11/15